MKTDRLSKSIRFGLFGFGVGMLITIASYITGLEWVWQAGFTVKCLGLYIMIRAL